MPRISNVAVAMSVTAALTLGMGATYYSVDARPAAPVASSAHAAKAKTTCAPKYTRKKSLLGLNASATFGGTSAFGKIPVVRTWVGTNADVSTTWRAQTRVTPRKSAMVISFRYSPQEVNAGRYDAQINAFFKHAPKKRLIFWNFYHEPEADVQGSNPKFTPGQFRKAFRHIDRISARYCRSNLVPTLVLMGWTANPDSGRSVNGAWSSWRDFYPGRKYVSVVAWDPYNSATVVPRSYAAPSRLYHYCVVDARRVHKPWAIAETGSALVAGDGGKGRAKWLHKVGKYSRKHNAAFVTYFSSVGRVNDFRLSDQPSINAWRAEMHHS